MTLKQVEEAPCNHDEVKVKVAYCGICGTDLHIWHDTFPYNPPVVIGHEISGLVIEKGKNVSSKISAGDRVAVQGSTGYHCKECIYCKSGYYMFCSDRKGMGHGIDGGFTSTIVVREDMLYTAGKDADLKHLALAEPIACVYQATEELVNVKSSDTVLVSGPGPIGLLCAELLNNKGCKVIVAGTNNDQERFRILEQLGIRNIINVNRTNLNEYINDELETGINIAFECSGSSTSINSCLDILNPMGTIVQVGIGDENINIDYNKIVMKQITIKGSLAHSMTSWEGTMKLIQNKTLNLNPIITDILPLEKWYSGFVKCENKNGGKVLLTP
nr:alcohol dehydrogenase catalytic domain-containing protein [Salinicoccus sp. YB14-2]